VLTSPLPGFMNIDYFRSLYQKAGRSRHRARPGLDAALHDPRRPRDLRRLLQRQALR
jgi:hypothetical protein